MKAMIFAAGLGTRMQHMTQDTPKALIEVGGKPVIDHVMENMIQSGFTDIVINVHHFARQIINHVQSQTLPAKISFSHEINAPLETGGGLWKVREFFNNQEPFLLHNADILTDLNLADLYTQHQAQKNAITLAVRDRNSSRKLLFTENKRLCGRWKANTDTTDLRWGVPAYSYAFSGVHVISPKVLQWAVPGKHFSIMEAYLNWCKEKPIGMYTHNQGYWFDIGSPEKWEEAQNFLKSNNQD
jgi:NDP-sugar pyrophosphorylase family protein